MSSVVGVSVGASAVRLTYRGSGADSVTVGANRARSEELAAASIGSLLAEKADQEPVQAIGIAYQNEAQAGAVRAALERQQIDNYRLVPEVIAAMRKLEESGELGGHSTLLFYDLGSSGLTVTMVDRSTGTILSAARTGQISGELFDQLIRDRQLALHHIDQPADESAARALETQCREAKEELSIGGTACTPGAGGLLVLSSSSFDSLIEDSVEESMILVREVIGRSGRTPNAVVLIGGGAHLPLVTSVMESALELPVIVPNEPERVAAEGAALLAESESDPVQPPFVESASSPPISADTTNPWRRRSVMVGGGVAVLVVVGIGLGLAANSSSGSNQSPQVVVTEPETSAPIAVAPPPAQSPQVVLPAPEAPVATPSPLPSPTTQVVIPPTTEPDIVPGPSGEGAQVPPQTDEGEQVPPPEPEPAPAPLIPGLPDIPLPVIPLPQIQFPQLPPPPPPPGP
ncbi:hypothetical protein BFN03_17665 [Rhodococcus sp. WMMA185]|uniref:Hsp70 family protein n=1 Tax=Rhodococcus sp. WMMA185 TaxID=679318 RepID=UPI0008781AD2|nr:Hsp70 family protein [Rhodococcus sp. WMMA185]AOW93867.1 hypothetical protein BFN03_17665 [Rhodococcus sp. WMMA185]